MKIHHCRLEHFTVFEQQELSFCEGVNVLIGANGTGKSHLLKALYAAAQTLPAREQAARDNMDILRFYQALEGVFKPENGVDSMIRGGDRKTVAVIELQSDAGTHYAELRRDPVTGEGRGGPESPAPLSWPPAYLDPPRGVFIPPNDTLAIYPGFMASYEKRELAFDQTYYDLCRALSAAPLRHVEPEFAELIDQIERDLSGKVIQRGDRFYVQGVDEARAIEAHLLAEGHRKIATLAFLIKNGALGAGSILFWDEPEANLNPHLVRKLATYLRTLAQRGIQVFVATHDYLLTGEMSLAAEYGQEPVVPIRFFAFSRQGEEAVRVQSGDTLASLDDNLILDEFAEHYQQEQTAMIQRIQEAERPE